MLKFGLGCGLSSLDRIYFAITTGVVIFMGLLCSMAVSCDVQVA